MCYPYTLYVKFGYAHVHGPLPEAQLVGRSSAIIDIDADVGVRCA